MTITISIPNIVINISNTQNLNLEQMAHTIDDLIAEVAKTKTLEDGAKTLISGLRQKVADAIANAGSTTGTSDAELAAIQAKVDETFAQLAASNSDFAGALSENTDNGGTTTPPATTPPVDTTPAPSTGGDATGGTTTGGDTTPPVTGGTDAGTDATAPGTDVSGGTGGAIDTGSGPVAPAGPGVPPSATTPDGVTII